MIDERQRFMEAAVRVSEKLRKRVPQKRTSTYQRGSIRQTEGTYAEIEAQRLLQDALGPDGGTVRLFDETTDLHPDDPRVAIGNSRQGDLFVFDVMGWLRFSVEVKSSSKYPNVSITWSELTESTTRFLIAVTPAGVWACTMDEARRRSRLVETRDGDFWLVPYDLVRRMTLKEIADAE